MFIWLYGCNWAERNAEKSGRARLEEGRRIKSSLDGAANSASTSLQFLVIDLEIFWRLFEDISHSLLVEFDLHAFRVCWVQLSYALILKW